MPRAHGRNAALTFVASFALSIAACEGASPQPLPDAGHDAGSSDAGDAASDAALDLDAGNDGATDDAMTDPCALGCPTGTYDVDDNPLTGTCGCEYACTFVSASDPFDATFTDENCDGGDGLVEQCVYVSTSQGLDVQSGTRTQPMQTITAALQQAQANLVPYVCVSGEVYTETYAVPSGIAVFGSFDHQDPDFTFRRKAGVTTTVNGSTLP